MSPEVWKFRILMVTVVGGNAVTIAVLKQAMADMNRRIERNEANIEKLFRDTRHVMSGEQIRRILHEQFDPLDEKVDIMHEDVITMKVRMRTRGDDEAPTFG